MRIMNTTILTVLGIGLLGVACASGPEEPNPDTTGTTENTVGTGGNGTGNAPGAGGNGTGNAPGAGGNGNPGAGGDANPNSGGAPNNGAGGGPVGTGGAPAVPEPELVVSGPDTDARSVANFWKEQPLTAGGTAATITVTSSQAKQDWHGFGGTFNEAGWSALMKLSAADRAAVMEALFSMDKGIGFDWGRIPVGPSDYAIERYHLSSAPGQFDISHDKLEDRGLIPFIKAAQTVKGDVKFWASPWTPPPWAKKSTTENVMESDGYDKGVFDVTKQADYVQFYVSWVDAYEKEGIPIDFVMPQNEPGYAQSYPTCSFGPATDTADAQGDMPEEGVNDTVTFGTFAKALYDGLQATEYKTGVWLGTLSNDKYSAQYFGSVDKSIVGGAGLQWNTRNHIADSKTAGILAMASEHKCGNYPWLTAMASSYQDATRDNFLAAEAPNNFAYGEESWDEFKAWINDGVNIYSAWNMVLDTQGQNMDEARPWPQNALLVVDRGTDELIETPTYYVFRHLSYFVDPGATRIAASGGNALAFKNPDGSIVTIIHNPTSAAAQTTVSVGGTTQQFQIPARGWATLNFKG